ncbi:MAG: LON peptidase substrate-binding domain-containing protein [Opitutae bacterium]|jgi:Lon protease-like protein|nr:LON peptidase substrate-binding domain-containing protein [Opitutae bacterium]
MTKLEIDIPPFVPAMTLRDAVLFPKAMMPLRIFEARYRQMLDDVLSGNRMFALAGVRVEDDPAETGREIPFDVATVGVIRISKKHEDGTSFVLLQGIERVRIRSINSEGPYPMLEVEPMKTKVDDSSLGVRQELVVQLKRNLKLGGEVTDEMMDFLNPLEDDVAFVNLAAFTLCKHTLRKQAMLEVSTLGKRANMLLDDLLRENERLDLLKKAIGDVPSEDFDSN